LRRRLLVLRLRRWRAVHLLLLVLRLRGRSAVLLRLGRGGAVLLRLGGRRTVLLLVAAVAVLVLVLLGLLCGLLRWLLLLWVATVRARV
jgi:hypothetical protein